MNNYINTIIISGDGHTNPSFIKLGNRSEIEKNTVNFVLPDGMVTADFKNTVVFKHEGGKTYTVDTVFNDPSGISCTVPVAVQSVPGYYTMTVHIVDSNNSNVFISNEVKCFIQGDNFGVTSSIAAGTMSTVQSPTMPYITIKGGLLYSSTDAEEWHLVLEPYIITSETTAGGMTIYEYGKLIIVELEDGSFNLKIGDGVTDFEDLPWVNIEDVVTDNPDELFFRAKGKWVTSDKMIDISEDGYWILGGVKTDVQVTQPTFSIGTVEDGDTGSVTITGTPENVELNFVLPRGQSSDTKVGNLEDLTTTDKTSVVGAINEVITMIPTTLDVEWTDVLNKPGIDGDVDIVISETQPTPVAGRTIVWIEGTK